VGQRQRRTLGVGWVIWCEEKYDWLEGGVLFDGHVDCLLSFEAREADVLIVVVDCCFDIERRECL
jgi:hypothetical protein